MKEEVGKKIGMSNWRCSFFHQPLNELPNVKSGGGKKEEEEEIESLFKMLKLAEFNSMKYSFNKKTRLIADPLFKKPTQGTHLLKLRPRFHNLSSAILPTRLNFSTFSTI